MGARRRDRNSPSSDRAATSIFVPPKSTPILIIETTSPGPSRDSIILKKAGPDRDGRPGPVKARQGVIVTLTLAGWIFQPRRDRVGAPVPAALAG
ncbi:hypothetical protein GCM10011317_46770 [Niveispirillum cyanobacteriorum]|nr:hypothetical protein GCM10011317_46770 [Niveispirillum cyanobacteriorum]